MWLEGGGGKPIALYYVTTPAKVARIMEQGFQARDVQGRSIRGCRCAPMVAMLMSPYGSEMWSGLSMLTDARRLCTMKVNRLTPELVCEIFHEERVRLLERDLHEKRVRLAGLTHVITTTDPETAHAALDREAQEIEQIIGRLDEAIRQRDESLKELEGYRLTRDRLRDYQARRVHARSRPLNRRRSCCVEPRRRAGRRGCRRGGRRADKPPRRGIRRRGVSMKRDAEGLCAGDVGEV